MRKILSLFVLAATVSTAHADQQQQVAQASVDRINELLECAAALEPEYASFGSGQLNSPGFFSLHISPRVIHATVFPSKLPEPLGINWELIFEVTNDEIYVLDQSVIVDPDTFLTTPNPLPEFPSAPELTQKAKSALIDCGAIWLGYWEFEHSYPFGGTGSESLLPPN